MIAIALLSFGVQWRFKSKFKQYAEIGLLSGLSGKEVAERMLRSCTAIATTVVTPTQASTTAHCINRMDSMRNRVGGTGACEVFIAPSRREHL